MVWILVGNLCGANAMRTLQLISKGKAAVSPTGDKVHTDRTDHTYYLCTRKYSRPGLASVESGITPASESPFLAIGLHTILPVARTGPVRIVGKRHNGNQQQ